MQLSPEVYGPVAIGQRMAAARTRVGYTVEDAAKACMMEPRVLAAIERGHRTVPEDALLCRLAGLYHTHPAILRYGHDALRDALATDVAAALQRAAAELEASADRLGVVLGTPITRLKEVGT